MKQHDGRQKNDNSRQYHIERIEKTRSAIKEVCERIRSRSEPRTFAHVSNSMKKYYDKPIPVSAQTLRDNVEYRQLVTHILELDSSSVETSIREHNPKSTAELRHELHQEKVKLAKFKSEIKILKHQIRLSNIELQDNIHNTHDISLLNQLKMSNESLLLLINELSRLGDFFWDREGFKRASDGKVFLTKKAMLEMGITPDEIESTISNFS